MASSTKDDAGSRESESGPGKANVCESRCRQFLEATDSWFVATFESGYTHEEREEQENGEDDDDDDDG